MLTAYRRLGDSRSVKLRELGVLVSLRFGGDSGSIALNLSIGSSRLAEALALIRSGLRLSSISLSVSGT